MCVCVCVCARARASVYLCTLVLINVLTKEERLRALLLLRLFKGGSNLSFGLRIVGVFVFGVSTDDIPNLDWDPLVQASDQ